MTDSEWEPASWPSGWVSVHDREPFLREVLAEVGPDHELAGYELAPVIKCTGCDSVVFAVDGGNLRFPRWAVVHLTWTGHVEASPWPRTTTFDGLHELRGILEASHWH
jgi:hypothetical protein